MLEHVSPATRLLEKRRQMFEVQEALEQQKQEYARKVRQQWLLSSVPERRRAFKRFRAKPAFDIRAPLVSDWCAQVLDVARMLFA